MKEHAVKLDSLPSGLRFPPALADRIHYEPESQRLVFRGFMYKSDYDRLVQLDSGVAYRRAVERLFQVSTEAESPQMRRLGYVLTALAAVCLLLAGVVWWQLLRSVPEPSDGTELPRSEVDRRDEAEAVTRRVFHQNSQAPPRSH